jgi:hypothetical protein
MCKLFDPYEVFEVSEAMSLKIQFFWDVTLDQLWRQTAFFRNVGNH